MNLHFANTLHKHAELSCRHNIAFAVQLKAHKNIWLGPSFPHAFPNSTFSRRTTRNTNSKHLTSNRQHVLLQLRREGQPFPSPKGKPTREMTRSPQLPSPGKELVLIAGEGGSGFGLSHNKPTAALGRSPCASLSLDHCLKAAVGLKNKMRNLAAADLQYPSSSLGAVVHPRSFTRAKTKHSREASPDHISLCSSAVSSPTCL